MTRTLKPCGTNAAYLRHLRHGEEPCKACREANRAYQRARYNGEFVPVPRELKPCGTKAAYLRHLRNGETPCRACKDANNQESQSYPGQGKYQRARQRAMVRLAHIYSDVYYALFAEEKAKEAGR